MPSGLVEAVDRMDPAGRRQTLRSIVFDSLEVAGLSVGKFRA